MLLGFLVYPMRKCTRKRDEKGWNLRAECMQSAFPPFSESPGLRGRLLRVNIRVIRVLSG